ncbi:MAG: hypothetical protein Q4F15_05305 [Bacillota bacterium]|nr:hypothetical protein [Bacillota bacterium]
MKSFVKKSAALLLLSGAIGALASCGGGSDSTSSSSSGESEVEQSFVAVTASSWDAEVTVGNHIYTFDLTLKSDKTLSFDATCVGESQSGGGGWGGWGFIVAEDASSSEATDYSSYDFSFDGSWVLETGYGYILSFEDEAETTIHVDYNKTQGRHEFYYSVVTDEGSATTLFQARDSAFRSTLASDYATWDERDSTYIFTGEVTGNNNSVAHAYIYCHSDGSAVYNTANGSDRAVTLGLSWALNDGTFTLTEGTSVYTASNSINSEHPGWRLSYDEAAFYCSTSSSVSWSDMTNGDFDGTTLYQFTGSYTTSGPDGSTKAVELNLTDRSTAFLYTGSTLTASGTYTYADSIFHIELSGFEAQDVSLVDGVYTYVYNYTYSSWGGSSTIEVALTYTPGA